MPIWVEAILLSALSLVFIAVARALLSLLERRAREEGRLAVRWL